MVRLSYLRYEKATKEAELIDSNYVCFALTDQGNGVVRIGAVTRHCCIPVKTEPIPVKSSLVSDVLECCVERGCIKPMPPVASAVAMITVIGHEILLFVGAR